MSPVLLLKETGQTPLSQSSSKFTFCFYSCKRKTTGAKEIPAKRKDYHPEYRRLSDILNFHLLCAFPLSDIYHPMKIYGI